jgi:DNA (cytosine-5)-methyltransferase 1
MSAKGKPLSKTYEVEMEVEVRKYDVPKDRLKALLRKHRNKSIEDIANILNKPITLVAHWFRTDKHFAIPDADIWLQLKELLGIETDEFDKAIMTFETQGGNYDMRNRIYAGDIAPTLMRGSEKNLYMVRVLENHPADSRVKICEDNIFQTLSSRMGTGGGNVPMVMEEKMQTVVRRLTPMECERLQGFPDGWTDIGDWVDSKGKTHKGESDSPRYKALGNSIAVGYANNKTGFWCWMAERIVKQLKADGVEQPTMASLFDGIGGFPLAFSAYGCDPVWASEIEEFPIAVTKIRFPDKEG